jgi:hypothetical protein
VWISVPKVNPYTTVHISLYNTFTGEGFYWEQMKVMICDGNSWDNTSAESVARADFYVEPEMNYTIRILDYFAILLLANLQHERTADTHEDLLEQLWQPLGVLRGSTMDYRKELERWELHL